jgi:hypothetical protein
MSGKKRSGGVYGPVMLNLFLLKTFGNKGVIQEKDSRDANELSR